MLPYITILNFKLPSYGVMIVLGIIIANLLASYIIRREHFNMDSFILLEAYGFLGAAIGAKLLYIIVSFRYIDWSRITDFHYLNLIMQSGFVFYGGLIGGLLFLIAGGLHDKTNVKAYLRKFIFMVPCMHCFGRIGCFLGGCCYGIPYKGIFAVTYPKGWIVPSDKSLFPVQLLEALLLFILSIYLYYRSIRNRESYSIEIYLIVYGIIRFMLEYLRYDAIRGHFGIFSTSQWISIALIILGITSILYRRFIEVGEDTNF